MIKSTTRSRASSELLCVIYSRKRSRAERINDVIARSQAAFATEFGRIPGRRSRSSTLHSRGGARETKDNRVSQKFEDFRVRRFIVGGGGEGRVVKLRSGAKILCSAAL